MFQVNPNKKVISKKVDAIINFIDPKKDDLGTICKEIIAKLKNKKIEKSIYDFVNNKTIDTDYIIEQVDNGRIKYVVNVIFNNNDRLYLSYTLIKILNELLDLKVKSISIPTIALKYLKLEYSDVNDIVLNTANDFYDKDVDIQIFNYIDESITDRINKELAKINIIEQKCDMSESRTQQHRDYSFKQTITPKLNEEELHKKEVKQNRIFLSAKAMGKINEKDFYLGEEEIYDRPIFFFEDYAMNNDYNLRKLVNLASKDNKGRRNSQLFNENRPISKRTVFILGFLLDFNQTLMVEALIHFGYCYNLNYPLDRFFFRCFQEGSKKYKNFSELQEYYYQITHELIYV